MPHFPLRSRLPAFLGRPVVLFFEFWLLAHGIMWAGGILRALAREALLWVTL